VISAYQFRLADVLFFLAHDERDRPRLRPRVQGVVLAAGLLGELVQLQKIGLHEGGVYIASRSEPDEALSAQIFTDIRSAPGLEPRVWLKALARVSTAGVTQRLAGAEVLKPLPPARRPTRWGRAGPAHRVTNAKAAELSWLVLMNKVHRRDELNSSEAYVVGVALATGLDTHLLEGASSASRAYAGRVADTVPGLLGHLVVQVEGVVGTDVLLYQ
jgi:hypothetical protein